MRDLPEGWEIRRLGDVLTAIDAGWSPLCEEMPPPTGSWGVLKVSAVTSGEYIPIESKTLLPGLRPNPSIEVRKGDILVCRANGVKRLVGAAVFVKETPPRLMLSDKILRLIPNESQIISAYLGLTLKSTVMRKQMAKLLSGGSGQNNISQKFIKSLDILIPPLGEQRRIAEILEFLEGEIRSCQLIFDKLTAIRSGVIEDSFQSEMSGWPECSLAELSSGRGEYGSNSPSRSYDERLPRYVRITDIGDRGTLLSESAVSISWETGRPYLLSEGDLLIARTGFTTGKSYLYRKSDGICAFAGYLVRFQISREIALPEYVFLWTQGATFSCWLGRSIKEVGQRNISAREYSEHRLPVPPISVQQKIVNRVLMVDSMLDDIQARLIKLQKIKGGLVDDLLAGQVRVKDVEDAL
ncbi:restriction endonuclease subunit S [Streptosporangium roseum]|uniref:restriction endonuclease subunit S n=1 Tax=Streptosporangium roseum TaxID=2001 RepID=UPI003331F82F